MRSGVRFANGQLSASCCLVTSKLHSQPISATLYFAVSSVSECFFVKEKENEGIFSSRADAVLSANEQAQPGHGNAHLVRPPTQPSALLP